LRKGPPFKETFRETVKMQTVAVISRAKEYQIEEKVFS
jgi:hypothetical protein